MTISNKTFRPVLFITFLINYCDVSAAETADLSEICTPYRTIPENVGTPAKTRDSIPYGEGLLWKIEDKDGHIVYLFGTMHSQDRLITNSLPPPVNLALHKSRIVVLEVLPDEAANQAFIEAMYLPGEQEIQSLLGETLYSELRRIMLDYGHMPEAIARVKPWAAFSLIGHPRPVRGPTLDEVLYQSAARRNKKLEGLETMEELVNRLDEMPVEDQLEILTDTICNHAQIVRDARQLRDLYISRDLAGIILFNNQPHHDEALFQAYIRRMIYDRNQQMVTKIEKYIKEGGAFIAVGASHLPDKQGLLNLLAGQGYGISLIY